MKNSNAMTDYTELKRLAEHHLSLGQAYTVAKPSVLLALIAENERLSADCSSMRGSLKANAVSIKKLIKDGGRAARERDQLSAEVAGLRTGYEAYERVNAELKAEVGALKDEISIDDKIVADRDRLLNLFECPDHGQCVPYAMEQVAALRKDAERYRWLRDSDYAGKILRDMGAKYRADADQRIDAALGQGEQS